MHKKLGLETQTLYLGYAVVLVMLASSPLSQPQLRRAMSDWWFRLIFATLVLLAYMKVDEALGLLLAMLFVVA